MNYLTTNFTVSPKEAKAELARRELARRHLRQFAGYVYEDYIGGWHIDTLCQALDLVEQGVIRFLLIEAPPRHSKSVNVSQLFPAYLVGKDPNRSVIVASYSGDLATKHGRETRNLIQSKPYQNVFKTRLAPDSTAKSSWNTQKYDADRSDWVNARGAYNAAGVGGSITGKGAHVGIIDDSIKDRKEAESQLIRENVWAWFRSVFRTRLTPDGAIVVMGTRWHMDDLAGRIMEEEPWVDFFDFMKNGLGDAKWVRLRLMAIAEEDEEHRQAGEALWPERYPLPELEDIKRTIGPYEWEALYQQRPISSETQEFKPAWYRYRTHSEVEQLERKHRTLTIDSAASRSESADYTGLCDNLVDSEGYWNLKAWKQKIPPDQLIEQLFTLHLANKYDRIGIEEGMYLLVVKPFLDKEMRQRGIYLPIVPLKHKSTQKEVRIRGLIPHYASESVYHIEGECTELEFEQSVFPNGKHDDVVDACFVAGTLIETISGPKQIERIQPGEMVLTRHGYKPVRHAWCTGYRPIIEKLGLKGTANHPIITTSGVKELQYVDESDILYKWNEKQLCIEEINTTDILNQNISTSAGTFGHTLKKVRIHSIVKYGLTIMDRFRETITSIILTVTHPTTQLRTLLVSAQANTRNIICDFQNEKNLLDKTHTQNSTHFSTNLGCGEKQKQAGFGIKNTLDNQSMGRQKHEPALNVHQNTKPLLSSPQSIVESGVEREQTRENLGGATQTTIAKVYNLEVEDAHEYFANGILVHNCAYQPQVLEGIGGGALFM